ncbi:hypothetical protein [Streptomyces sp. NPDC052179]|uniref:hypothetical protein n=1 Tax=Streptomyces sp. NPDC052179 TaxID=3155680 RepID=UPI00341DAEF1
MTRTRRVSGNMVLVVAALSAVLAGCGGDDSSDGSAPSPSPERTTGPGTYAPPDRLCDLVDFSELATAVAPFASAAQGRETGGDPSVSSGSECKQSLSNGTTVHARAVAQCSAWKDIGKAIGMHRHGKETAEVADSSLTDVKGLGNQAYRYVSSEDGPWKADLRLVVRDSNLDCEFHTQSGHPMDAQDLDITFAAMEATAKNLLPKLRP